MAIQCISLGSHIELKCNVKFNKMSIYPEEEGRPWKIWKKVFNKYTNIMTCARVDCAYRLCLFSNAICSL